jgi:hypothetical protein
MNIGNHAYYFYFVQYLYSVSLIWRLPSVSSSRVAGLGSSFRPALRDCIRNDRVFYGIAREQKRFSLRRIASALSTHQQKRCHPERSEGSHLVYNVYFTKYCH